MLAMNLLCEFIHIQYMHTHTCTNCTVFCHEMEFDWKDTPSGQCDVDSIFTRNGIQIKLITLI